MPFAYAGTRRRRNRDRRRTHDALDTKAQQPDRAGAIDTHREGDAREADSPNASGANARGTSNASPSASSSHTEATPRRGAGSDDPPDAANRDPDAPPVDNRS